MTTLSYYNDYTFIRPKRYYTANTFVVITYYPCFDANVFFPTNEFCLGTYLLNIAVFCDIGPISRIVARYYC